MIPPQSDSAVAGVNIDMQARGNWGNGSGGQRRRFPDDGPDADLADAGVTAGVGL